MQNEMNAVQVNYINAHATSTLVGDIAEIKAVKSAFPDTKHLKVNGTKSMIGHCLGAAGGMGPPYPQPGGGIGPVLACCTVTVRQCICCMLACCTVTVRQCI